jgi:hypothetical protein
LKGTKHDIASLLADGVVATVAVTIVQPGVGRQISPAQSNLLASANAYLVADQLAPLRVLGSASVQTV